MVAYLPRLDEADVTTAATATHGMWGRHRSLAEHVAHVSESLRRAEGRVELAGLFDDGELVCSLEKHHLLLASANGTLPTLGIASVFTPERHRGRGHARSLIENVMTEGQAAGARATLLFTDIDPTFYEKLGFETLSHVTWTARTEALPNVPGRLQPTSDLARLLSAFEASWRPAWLRMQRSEASWRYAAWRRQSGDAFLVGENDYVLTRLIDRTLWIDDAATNEISREQLWGSLRSLASALGATHVSGWLRPDQAGGPFVAAGRKTCIPMLASDEQSEGIRSHFASLDRF
jgi:predicted N-acetyltransferase YhbS